MRDKKSEKTMNCYTTIQFYIFMLLAFLYVNIRSCELEKKKNVNLCKAVYGYLM